MADAFPLPGFPQLTRSGHRLVRVPPFATGGFSRTHLSASVLPANRHLVFSSASRRVARGVATASSLNQHPEFTPSRNRRVEKRSYAPFQGRLSGKLHEKATQDPDR